MMVCALSRSSRLPLLLEAAALALMLLLFSAVVLPASTGLQSSPTEGISPPEAREIIDRVYRDVLHRDPDPEGLRTYTDFLANQGKDENWLRSVLEGSSEKEALNREKNRRTRLLMAVAAAVITVVACLVLFRKAIVPSSARP